MSKVGDLSIRRSNKDLKSVLTLWGSGSDGVTKKQPRELLHRSDMLLEKQVNVASSIIEQLGKTVAKFEKCQTPAERTLLQEIIVLNRKGQHLKIVLEILNKINLEIKIYRGKLHDAIKNHSEEAELIRQRITWLERRLEKIVTANSAEQLKEMFKMPQVVKEMTTPKSILHVEPSFSKSYLPSKKAVILAPLGCKEFESDSTTWNNSTDEGDRYWLSGHHRFTYTPNMGPLLEENPLSYHNIGLAVPASYVDRNVFSSESGHSPDLQWMNEQDPMKGNFDILRDDLEKIQKRIHRIHRKIYDAANLSVNLESSDVQPMTKPQSQDTSRLPNGTPQTAPATPATAQGRHSTRDTSRSITAGSLARISSTATPASSTVSIYSDMQLPANLAAARDIMPLTRTNASKRYPHNSDRWSNAQPNQDGLALQPTIVNQRDLQNKTKLRLFIPKRTKRRGNVVRDLITPSSITSSRSYRKVTNTVRFIENLKSSEGSGLSELQKQRLAELVKTLKTSPRIDDRIYAARSLSSLGVTASEDTASALIDVLAKERSSSVRFELSKALIKLGEWHGAALCELTMHLDNGNHDVCLDVLEQLACCDNVRTMHLQIDEIPELRQLIEVLQLLAAAADDSGEISFQAAVCLGEICGIYDAKSANIASAKLLSVIKTTSKWHWHSQALEVLVRQLNHFDENTLRAIITQLKHAVKWQDRLAAALLIAHSGPAQVFRVMQEKEAFDVFYPKLWDDVRREVRLGVSQAFTALGLRNRLLEELDDQINDPNPEVRSRAVMAMSAVGIRSDRTLRFLVEMLGLDSSDYVRLQIMRAFHALGITDIRAVRALREREKGDGPLAREASKILASMDVRLTTGVSSVAQSRRRDQSGRQMTTADGRLTTSSSWFSSPWGGNRDHTDTRESKKRSRRGQSSRNFSENRQTSSSQMSSGFTTSPQYEFISTTVRRARASAGRRAATGDTRITSASSFF